jgi:hypothetical protein
VKVGITGHQRLEDPDGWVWVKIEMDDLLMKMRRPLVGITCLAAGADSLFAELILQQGGSLEAVVPFPEYEKVFAAQHRNRYQALLGAASAITVLEKGRSKQESYFAAGKKVVDAADLLLTVWDGKPARGLGGTADIVEYAHQELKQVIHLNPTNRSVTEC